MLEQHVPETVFGRFLSVISHPEGAIFPHTHIAVGKFLRPGVKPRTPEDALKFMVRGVRITVQVPPRGDKPETKQAAKEFKEFAEKLEKSVAALPKDPRNELARALRRGDLRRVVLMVRENKAHGYTKEKSLEAYVPRDAPKKVKKAKKCKKRS